MGETTSNIFAKCKVLWGKQLGKYRCCDDASHFGPFRQTSSQPLFCGQLFSVGSDYEMPFPRPCEAGSERISKSGAGTSDFADKTPNQLPASTDSESKVEGHLQKEARYINLSLLGTKNYSRYIGLLLCHCIMLYSCLSMLGCRANTTSREESPAHLPRHYLEQVIVALHERSTGARSHVPYRTEWYKCTLADLPLVSFTAVPLKDSDVENACCQELDDDFSPSGFSWLESHDPCEVSSQQSCKFLVLHFAGGNCKTVMVGTAAIEDRHLEECQPYSAQKSTNHNDDNQYDNGDIHFISMIYVTRIS